MATLTSSSTRSEVLDEYADTCGYLEDGDVDKAKRFVSACRRLKIELLKRVRHGGQAEVERDLERYESEITAALSFIANFQSTTNPQIIHADFSEFRS